MTRVYKKILFLTVLIVFLLNGCKKPADNVIEKGTVSDFEGNVYPTVKLGTQWWMAKNLKATKYSNGEQIGTTTPYSLPITGVASPKYNWPYQGNESFAALYGRLYTWYAVTDSRNLCPAGWHVPTDIEWNVLTDYLTANDFGFQGGTNNIAKAMSATSGWLLNGIIGVPGNDQATNNTTFFAAMPGGFRVPSGSFQSAGSEAYYWSSTADIPEMASYRMISFDINTVQTGNMSKDSGISVRCVKD